MKKILILDGYGYTGKLIARHLLEQSTASIILASRNIEKLQAYARQLNSESDGKRVSSVFADALNAESVRTALRGVDFFLVAAPTTLYAEIVIRTARECKTDYHLVPKLCLGT